MFFKSSAIKYFAIGIFCSATLLAQKNKFKIDSLYDLAKKTSNDTVKAKYFNRIALLYIRDDNALEALKALQNVKPLYKKSKYQTLNLAKNYHNLSSFFAAKSKFSEADQFLDTAIAYRETVNDRNGIVDAINSRGIIRWRQADYNKALSFYMEALKEGEKLKDTLLYIKIYNNIGIIYYQLKRYNLAVDYYKKVLVCIDSLKDPAFLASTLDNIGIAYLELKEQSTALNYNLRSLAIKQLLKNDLLIASSYLNIGNIYYAQENYHNALVYYQKSKLIKEKARDTMGLVHCYNDIASVYMSENNFSLAHEYQLKGLEFARKIGFKELVKELLKGLSESNYHLKNYKEAYDFFARYTVLKDSLFNSESNMQITEMETKYQSEKKEQENILLKQKNEIQLLESDKKDGDLKKQRTIILSVSIGLALMFVLIVIVLKGYRDKQKANDIISHQKHLVEEKQKEILDSIYYARRIQRALMTNEKYIGKKLDKLSEEQKQNT